MKSGFKNLTLNGKNLNRASKETEMRVQIGTKFCNVTSVSQNQLTCEPPEHQPPAILSDGREDHNQPPDVVVMIGEKLRYTVGKLNYNEAGTGA
jgi:plexin A